MGGVGDIVTFSQRRGLQRTWVPKDEESWWIEFWGRGGIPAARWADYHRWGGFWPRFSESADRERLPKPHPPVKRKRTNYAQWTPPK